MTATVQNNRIAIIPGDGIGPEIFEQIIRVLEVLNTHFSAGIQYTTFPYGAEYYLKHEITLPPDFLEELHQHYGGVLLGPLGDQRVLEQKHARDILYGLRQKFDLFFNYQHIQMLDPWYSAFVSAQTKTVDLYLLREQNQTPSGRCGDWLNKSSANEIALQSYAVVSNALERCLRSALQFADRKGLNKAVVVVRPNYMYFLADLWQRMMAQVGSEFPRININAMALERILNDLGDNPDDYQAIITSEFLGDIIQTVTLKFVGGTGMGYVGELGATTFAVLRVTQSSTAQPVGHGFANPFGAFYACIELLNHLGYTKPGELLANAVTKAITGHLVSMDVRGMLSTEEVGNYLVDFILEQKTET